MFLYAVYVPCKILFKSIAELGIYRDVALCIDSFVSLENPIKLAWPNYLIPCILFCFFNFKL